MKAFIFDLDGVIVFTDKFHYKAWKMMADSIGVYFDEEINHRLRGVSRAESLDIILERYEGEPLPDFRKQELMEMKNNIYRSYLENMTPEDVDPIVRGTLKRLSQDYRIAIGSSSKNAMLILEKVGLADVFHAISDGNNISHSKPDPEVFLKAASFLSVEPEECYVVEDARAGVDAAKAAHMQAIGIGEASKYDRTDYQIDSFDELLKFVR